MGFGKRIKDRRAELRMSSTQLAEKIGVSKQTISGYELERTYPNPEKLSRIITALDCDANYHLSKTYYMGKLCSKYVEFLKQSVNL